MYAFSDHQKNHQAIVESHFSCQREGLTIRGTEFRPAGDQLPVAIVSHGFMGTEETVRQYALPLAQLGYAVYTFDYCGGNPGTGKSDGKTTEMSVLTEVRDLEAVMAYTVSRPYTDSNRMLLAGARDHGGHCNHRRKALRRDRGHRG